MAKMPPMQLEWIEGVRLETYDSGGTGDPVLLVHGGMADECLPLLQESVLTTRFRLIAFKRRGFGQSELPPDTPVGYERQASDCLAVLRHHGIERAHLVGQSGGGNLILQLARQAPHVSCSLALLEPALSEVLNEEQEWQAAEHRAGTLYESGDELGALDALVQALVGPDYRGTFDRHLPEGWYQRWVADRETLFGFDLPGLATWKFSREDAAGLRQPVMILSAEHTMPFFRRVQETLLAWFPQAERVVVPDARHLMLQWNPSAVADRLAQFFTQHPMQAQRRNNAHPAPPT